MFAKIDNYTNYLT